jgi:hypothetical protein
VKREFDLAAPAVAGVTMDHATLAAYDGAEAAYAQEWDT